MTSGSNVARDVHRCGTVDYQQIENDNIANQIHRFTVDYGKFILIINSKQNYSHVHMATTIRYYGW